MIRSSRIITCSDLLLAYAALPASDTVDKSLTQSERLAGPPYIGRRHLFTLLRYRVKTSKDIVAEKFVRHQQGALASLFDGLRFGY